MLDALAILIIIAVSAASIVVAFSGYLHEKNGKWHVFDSDTARRFIDGRWQYRKLTDVEGADFDNRRAW